MTSPPPPSKKYNSDSYVVRTTVACAGDVPVTLEERHPEERLQAHPLRHGYGSICDPTQTEPQEALTTGRDIDTNNIIVHVQL